MYPRMSGGNGKWSSGQRLLDHVNIDATKSINLVLTRAYVPLFFPYGVKMDTLFLKICKIIIIIIIIIIVIIIMVY